MFSVFGMNFSCTTGNMQSTYNTFFNNGRLKKLDSIFLNSNYLINEGIEDRLKERNIKITKDSLTRFYVQIDSVVHSNNDDLGEKRLVIYSKLYDNKYDDIETIISGAKVDLENPLETKEGMKRRAYFSFTGRIVRKIKRQYKKD